MSKEESVETAPAKPVPPPKPAATKAAAAPASSKTAVPRRSLLSWVTLAWVAFTASMLASLTATARFMFPNVLFEPPPTFKAGFPNEIQIGQVDERFKQRFAVWLVRSAFDEWGMGSGIYALSTVCTHLGCTPNWLEAEQKFKCPCHGSGYYKTGVNFEGPTPRPLERYAIALADDGQILVDKSRKFQEEKGEWTNPAAFLKL
ncbi:MAG: Rieske (2Fe-2S) protein [Acidobacteria bacterium]|jgi:cytochrome b6-f complex iron-sulfur subunit|nr:MAG: Rieske (2Fe-2S) protein [Acidobacteriota bacterium]